MTAWGEMLRVIVSAALAVLLMAMAASQQPSYPQTPPPDQSPSSDQAGRSNPPTIIQIHPAEKTESEREEEAKERREKTELDRRLVDLTGELARFTAGLFYATIALFLATACLAYFGWRQSRDMKESIVAAKQSADVAEKTLVATQRPWISVHDIKIKSPLYFAKGGAHLPLTFELKNTGSSPALFVNVAVRLFPLHKGTVDMLALQREVREKARAEEWRKTKPE